jgi:hypothetical protein
MTVTRSEMKSTENAMLRQPKIVKVTDPEVTGADPVPDDTEPFMLPQRTDDEIADYDKGFECGQNGGQNDDTKSEAWQRGWAEAQE